MSIGGPAKRKHGLSNFYTSNNFSSFTSIQETIGTPVFSNDTTVWAVGCERWAVSKKSAHGEQKKVNAYQL